MFANNTANCTNNNAANTSTAIAQIQQQMQQPDGFNSRYGGSCSSFDTTNDVYQQIVANTTSDKESLAKLYETDQILFNRLFIDSTIALGEIKIYTVFNFSSLSTLLQSKMFSQFALTKDSEIRQTCNKILDTYFRAICKYSGVQFMPVKQKILTLLGIQVEIPTIQPMSVLQSKVNVSTNYKPKEVKLYTAKIDIENIQRDMYCQSLANCTPIEVSYDAFPNVVQLRGSILPNIIESMLISIEVAKRNDIALGIQTQTYGRKDFDILDSNGVSGGATFN